MTVNGIVQGIRSLIGYYYDVGERRRVNEIFRAFLILILCVMVIGTLLSWCIPKTLIGIFTSNEETIQIGSKALRMISLGFIVSGASPWPAAALWKDWVKDISPFADIPIEIYYCDHTNALLFSRFLESDGVWISFVFAEAVSAIFAGFIYRTTTKSKKSLGRTWSHLCYYPDIPMGISSWAGKVKFGMW